MEDCQKQPSAVGAGEKPYSAGAGEEDWHELAELLATDLDSTKGDSDLDTEASTSDDQTSESPTPPLAPHDDLKYRTTPLMSPPEQPVSANKRAQIILRFKAAQRMRRVTRRKLEVWLGYG